MKIAIITLGLILAFCVSAFAQGTTQYVYDANGRLTHVISASGQVAVYEYDFAGNLTRIRNEQNPVLLISNFSPGSGNIGTSVTIRGVGFSTISAQNQVKFNGVSAIVSASTLTELTVTVPIGATTGKIQVTNLTGTALSSANFNVLQGSPTITSFTPNLGNAGNTVSVNGRGFSNIADENLVKFNRTNSLVSDSTINSLETTVPVNAVSGKISVSTDYGDGTSSDDFYVVPNNFTVADVSQTARLNYAQTYPVNLPIDKQLSLFVFEGTAGSKVHIDMRNVHGILGLEIRSPDNSQVWQSGTSADSFQENINLRETGTYSISVRKFGNDPANVDLTLYQSTANDINEPILTDGTPKTVNISSVGQNARLNFSVGQTTLVLRFRDVTASNYSIKVFRDDGQLIQNVINSPTNLIYLTGNFYILFDPDATSTGSATFSLKPIENITDTIQTDGTPKTVDFPIAGQNAELTFSATAGQNYGLRISDASAVSANFSVISPTNQIVSSGFLDYGYTGATAAFSTNEPGTYKILYDPQNAVTGLATFELNLLNEVVGNLVINDPIKTFTSTLAGQGFRINFTGNQGQRFYLKTIATDFYHLSLTIKTPNDIDLVTNARLDGDTFFDIDNLPDSGVYTLLIYPDFPHQFGNLQLQAIDDNVVIENNPLKSIHAYFVDRHVGDIARKNKKKKAANFTVPNVAYHLNANANDLFSFTTQPIAQAIVNTKPTKTPSFVNGTMTIYKPDGTLLDSSSIDLGFCNLNLPVTGEYIIEVSPIGGTQDFILRNDCGPPPQDRPKPKNGGKKRQ